jgi:hypothetical protein
MTAKEISNLITTEPFRPFEVLTNDGERIVIRKPLRALVTQTHLLLGVDEDKRTGLSSRLRRLGLGDVAKVIPADNNGSKNSRA